MSNKKCLIVNFAPHYRYSIYKKMSEDLFFDFYFGNKVETDSLIRTMDFSRFLTEHHEIPNLFFPYTHFYWQKGVTNLLKKYDIIVVVGELYCITTWIIGFFNRIFYKKKVIFWTHGMYGDESFIKRAIKRVFFSLPNRILVYGNHAIDLMKRNGINSEKLYLVHNSLDYDNQCRIVSSMPKENPFPALFHNNHSTIVFSGRLTPEKHLNLLIETLFLLKNEKCFINCLIIGDGSERLNLEQDVIKYKMEDSVLFYGECYNETTLGLMYWNAALCVCPGRIGLTAIHAMTFGCPVLTHNIFSKHSPEFEAILPNVSGDFFICDDMDSLKDYIKKWVSISKREREVCNRNCRDIIRKDWNPSYQIRIINEAILSAT